MRAAMPLGGIGTGTIAICGDGGLRQCQLLGRPNHSGWLPDTFFAIRCSQWQGERDESRFLIAEPKSDIAPAAPLVTDGQLHPNERALLARYGGVAATTFQATYPLARIGYSDPALPLEIELQAWSPLVPLDTERSSLPVAMFDFRLRSIADSPIDGCVAASLQNFVGWDGFAELGDSRSALYGGNVNRMRHDRAGAWIVMDNPTLADRDARAGQAVLAAEGSLVIPFERTTSAAELFTLLRGTRFDAEAKWRNTREYLEERTRLPAAVPSGASPPGTTWNGALALPFRLAPGASTELRFAITWWFPNRVVDFEQPGPYRALGASAPWLGNAYAERFRDAEHVLFELRKQRKELELATSAWGECFAGGELDGDLLEGLAAQPVSLRSPTCFVAGDGRLYGFEGGMGASTAMWGPDRGGSCPLNCTHVWNYEQAVSRLFPELERGMRATELEVTQAPDGSIPHRVIVPPYLPQLWDGEVGGPERPALDGMLGAPLKVLRELHRGAGQAWLEPLWPRLVRLLDHISDHWDADGDGILRGEQPNTYDMSFHGANTFVGSLWLAALLAVARLAEHVGDSGRARQARSLFERASAGYDELLWNGSYYVQEESAVSDYQYGCGCLSDQLIGQWWASQLRLGRVLPAEHERGALEAIVEYNFREDLSAHQNEERRFADGSDAGLLNCTWPRGGRPARPVLYCDEVWTGTEYAVAHLCLGAGLEDAALRILRAVRSRHDGTRRNPFNEIECGDHYVRAMSGWALTEALPGCSYDASAHRLALDPRPLAAAVAVPIVGDQGWGRLVRSLAGGFERLELQCKWGRFELEAIELPAGAHSAGIELSHGQRHPAHLAEPASGGGPDGVTCIRLVGGLSVSAGSTLEMRWPQKSAD